MSPPLILALEPDQSSPHHPILSPEIIWNTSAENVITDRPNNNKWTVETSAVCIINASNFHA
jgi:hypothetical protein